MFVSQGGSLQLDSSAGNNYPLRGGKLTDFEGGIRAVTVVNGGALPDERRGEVEGGLMHIADWYVTFCSMLGIDPQDHAAVEAGLPDVDGYDMWPLIRGQVADSPRTELVISSTTFIAGDWKLMRGVMDFARWQTPIWPDASTPSEAELEKPSLDCRKPNECLFNVASDMSEFENLAHILPDVVEALNERFDELAEGFYENDRTGLDSCPKNYRLTVQVGQYGNVQDVDLSCGCWMGLNCVSLFSDCDCAIPISAAQLQWLRRTVAGLDGGICELRRLQPCSG